MKEKSSPAAVKIRRLQHAEGLPLPAYQTSDAAGMDLLAAVAADAPVILKRGGRALVPTGLVFELPSGMEAQVRPRSGLAVKFGVTVLNSPGTIDADYRGEVSVILINHGDQPFAIQRGDRIAQLVLMPVMRAKIVESAFLTETQRGAGGFGSTGVAATKVTKPEPKSARKTKRSVPKRTAVASNRKNAKTVTQRARKPKRTTASKR